MVRKFEAGDFDLNDKPCSVRPSLIDDDIVKTMWEQNPFLTTSEIAENFGLYSEVWKMYCFLLLSKWSEFSGRPNINCTGFNYFYNTKRKGLDLDLYIGQSINENNKT